MNEVLIKKYINKLIKQGVSKYMAREIVYAAAEIAEDTNLDTAVNYAMRLVYGVGFKKVNIM